MKLVLSIWYKEMVDTLRDRRTLILMVGVPLVLMPALFVGLAKLIEMQAIEAEQETLELLVVGGERAQQLTEFLAAKPRLKLQPAASIAEAEEAVRKKEAKLALVVEDAFDESVAAERAVRLTVLNNETDVSSIIKTGMLKGYLDELRDRIVAGRLETRKVDAAILAPLRITPRNMASPEEMAGFVLGMIIPLILLTWAITGGMYMAIDLSAGEKERATLEALLLSPASRTQITLGKFAAVFTVSYATMIAALISLFLTFLLFPLTLGGAAMAGPPPAGADGAAMPGISFQISIEGLLLMLLISILLAATFSALELALGIFAKSFKEAQNLISPLYLVVVLPVVVVNSLPSFRPTTGYFLIPGVNAVLLFKELLMGTHSAEHVGATFVSMALCSAACLVATIRVFNREGVLLKA